MDHLPLIRAGLLLAFFSPAAWCTVINGTGGAAITYVTGGAVIADGSGVTFQGRTWDVPSARTVRVSESLLPRIAGHELPLTAVRTIPPAAIARAGAGALARGLLGPIGVGLTVYEIYDALRIKPDGSGGLTFDPGVPPLPGSESPPVEYQFEANGWTTNRGAVEQQMKDKFCSASSASQPNGCVMGSVVWSGAAPVSAEMQQINGEWGIDVEYKVSKSWTFWTTAYPRGAARCPAGSKIAVKQGWGDYSCTPITKPSSCPASIDPFDPAHSVPAGGAPGPDGRCPTARGHWQPISPLDAGDRLEQFNPPPGEKLKDWAKEITEKGGALDGASERSLTGPAQKTGTPTTTTTTAPGGGVTTTTQTPTTNYTYNNNTVNYNTSITTVTNNSDGTTTTVEDKPPPEESDQCKANPESLGCQELGEPPTGDPSWSNSVIPFQPDDLGLPAACPAPYVITVRGWELKLIYKPLCDVASYIRAAVVILTAIGASFFILGAVKS